jgi:hypothetical protein
MRTTAIKSIKTSEDARKYASLCERHADTMTNPELKAALLEVAKEWREHAEALDRQGTARS